MTNEQKIARVKEIDEALGKMVDEKNRLTQEVTEDRSYLKIGDGISWATRRGSRRGRVIRVIPGGWTSDFSVSRYVVEPVLKSGSFGSPVYIYTWESNKITKVVL